MFPLSRPSEYPLNRASISGGDMITETLPALLCKTAEGDYSRIMDIVRDRDPYQYLRTGALEALKLGVASGELPREEGIALFATLSDETLAKAEDYFWGSPVHNLHDIYPIELIAEIRDLYAKGSLFEGDISLEEVEEVIAAGFDATNANLEKLCAWRLPEDMHSYMSWFAGFQKMSVWRQNSRFHQPGQQKRTKQRPKPSENRQRRQNRRTANRCVKPI